jgi:hypothetical protein
MKKQIYLSIALLTFLAAVVPASGSNQPATAHTFEIKNTNGGNSFKLEYNENTTVGDVKKILSEKTGIPVDSLHLLGDRTVLGDNVKIAEYAVNRKITFYRLNPESSTMTDAEWANSRISTKQAFRRGDDNQVTVNANYILNNKRATPAQKASAQAWLELLK